MRSIKFKVGDIVIPKEGRFVKTTVSNRITFPREYGNELKFEIVEISFHDELVLELSNYSSEESIKNIEKVFSNGVPLPDIDYEDFTDHYIDPNSVKLYKEPKEALLKKFF